jgi:uncharacterized protein YcaQ
MQNQSLEKERTISLVTARRLALVKQHLDGRDRLQKPNSETIFKIVKDLAYLQIDPISVVAKSHLLVLWSRLGKKFDPKELDRLLWEERKLFEYYAHAASIVLTEDYPIHKLRMRSFGKRDTLWHARLRSWMEKNSELRTYVLRELKARGPIPSRSIEDLTESSRKRGGWANERKVNQMLEFLLWKGEVMVADRAGGQKVWNLSERFLPSWTPKETELSPRKADKLTIQRSLRALGVATQRQTDFYFLGFYRGFEAENRDMVYGELLREGLISRVKVEGAPGKWYILTDDLPLLDKVEEGGGEKEPLTTLLSPFDNLIIDRPRTKTLFDYTMSFEIYVPKAQRIYGYYVMPILHGDRLIGRIDPRYDRESGRLFINAVHAEKNAPADAPIASSIRDLADFLGASEVVYERGRVPKLWRKELS